MFVAGTSMVGLVHQVIWLTTSEQSLYGERLVRHQRYYASDKNQMKFQGIAVHNFYDMHGTFPTNWDFDGVQKRHSWATQILPYIGYNTETIDMNRLWDDPVNANSFRVVLPDYCNPEFRAPPLQDRQGFGLNHYAGNSLVLGGEESLQFKDIKGGSSNTLLIGQVNSRFVAWGNPDSNRDPRNGINAPNGFGGAPQSRSARFLMVDGSVRLVSQDIDPAVLNAISTPDDD